MASKTKANEVLCLREALTGILLAKGIHTQKVYPGCKINEKTHEIFAETSIYMVSDLVKKVAIEVLNTIHVNPCIKRIDLYPGVGGKVAMINCEA